MRTEGVSAVFTDFLTSSKKKSRELQGIIDIHRLSLMLRRLRSI